MSTQTNLTGTNLTQTNRSPQPWLLVAKREVLAKVTDKAFLIGTLVTVALIAGYMGFMALQAGKSDDVTLAAVGTDTEMAQSVAGFAESVDDDLTVTVTQVVDEDAARAALAEEEADAWLHPGADGWLLTYHSSEDKMLTRLVSQGVQQEVLTSNAASVGSTVAELQAGAGLTAEFVKGDAEKAMVAEIVGFALAFLFYLAAMLFGMQLANSVVEEKQSRIVEIIAAAIPLRHLLAGKVLGNTVLAMIQVLVYVAVGLVGLSFTEYASYVPSLSGPAVWFVVFFLLGFGALSCLWAVAGSLAARTEDLQATTTPLTMLLVVVFIGTLSLEGSLREIASFVPISSAILMPQRILEGSVGWWEPTLAALLTAAFALLTILVGERVYRRSLLQTGSRVSLRQAWSASE